MNEQSNFFERQFIQQSQPQTPGFSAMASMAASQPQATGVSQSNLGLEEDSMNTKWAKKLKQFQSSKWAPTPVTPEESPAFKSWLTGTALFNNIKQIVAKENGIPVGQMDNNRLAEMMLRDGDYDYVGAWKAGVKEEISQYDGMPHWPSRSEGGKWLKSPKHDTAWKELFMEQYGTDPDELGLGTFEQALSWSKKQRRPQAQNGGVNAVASMAGSRPLLSGVIPSNAGAGRGFVNPVPPVMPNPTWFNQGR